MTKMPFLTKETGPGKVVLEQEVGIQSLGNADNV